MSAAEKEKISKAQELRVPQKKSITMKNTEDPRKNEKKTPPDTDTMPRELPSDEPAIEEYIDDKSNRSEDKSEVDPKK